MQIVLQDQYCKRMVARNRVWRTKGHWDTDWPAVLQILVAEYSFCSKLLQVAKEAIGRSGGWDLTVERIRRKSKACCFDKGAKTCQIH